MPALQPQPHTGIEVACLTVRKIKIQPGKLNLQFFFLFCIFIIFDTLALISQLRVASKNLKIPQSVALPKFFTALQIFIKEIINVFRVSFEMHQCKF